jgi:hypothetical protein
MGVVPFGERVVRHPEAGRLVERVFQEKKEPDRGVEALQAAASLKAALRHAAVRAAQLQ